MIYDNNFFAFLLLIFSISVPVAFAQSDEISSHEVTELSEYVLKADSLLEVNVVFPLAGMAITAASFLFTRLKSDDENKEHLRYAKESFIKAFFGLIICGIVIFAFDFLEIRHGPFFVYLSVADVLITFGLFGYSMLFFIKGANGLRRSIR